MNYFNESEIFSTQLPFTYADNKLDLHKKRKSFLITNINHNLGDIVAEGTVSGGTLLQRGQLQIIPFLEIQDVPICHGFIRKTKILNNSCNQFVYNFYLQSILVLEECLQKW